MGITVGRIFQTEVRVHWTWVPIMAFISVIFGIELTDGTSTGLPAGLAWASSISCAVLVFVSVAAHELAHVWVARRFGQSNPTVVVQLLGGPYVMETDPKSAGEELRIAIAGSLLSGVVAIVFAIPALVIDFGPLAAAPDPVQAVGFVATMVAIFNAMLGLINLVPGYPMDGARVLHAVAWSRTGSQQAAAAVAIRVGRYVGYCLIGVGLVAMTFTDALAGFSLVIAGWLVMNSSKFLDRRSGLEELLAGVKVGDVEDPDPGRVPPQLTLDVYAASYLAERNGAAALVERGDNLIGLIGSAQIRRIPGRLWPTTHTEQAMMPIADVPRVSRESDLWPALETLERRHLDALVIDGGQGPTALLTRRSAAKLIQERAAARQIQLAASAQLRKTRFRDR
jgi:Zn-dependent protease